MELKVKEICVFNYTGLFFNGIFHNNYFKKHISKKTKLKYTRLRCLFLCSLSPSLSSVCLNMIEKQKKAAIYVNHNQKPEILLNIYFQKMIKWIK